MSGVRVLIGLLLLVSMAEAQTSPFPLTTQQTSGVASSQSIVLTPRQTTQTVRVYDFSAQCSAGTASLSILDGATTIRQYPGAITTSLRIGTFTPFPLIATRGNTMTLTVTSCGGGNTSTLSVRADSY